MEPLEEETPMSVAEHERGWAISQPDSPFGELMTVREMSRQHIEAARTRIERSRRRQAAAGAGRATQSVAAPARGTAPPVHLSIP